MHGQAKRGVVSFKVLNLRRDAEPEAGAQSWRLPAVPGVNSLGSDMRGIWGSLGQTEAAGVEEETPKGLGQHLLPTRREALQYLITKHTTGISVLPPYLP